MHETSGIWLVNPAAIDASSGDKDTPTVAVLNAAQSFAPSPHINVVKPSFLKASTNKALCSGAIRANTLPFFNIKRYDWWINFNFGSLFFIYLSLSLNIFSKTGPVIAIPKLSLFDWYKGESSSFTSNAVNSFVLSVILDVFIWWSLLYKSFTPLSFLLLLSSSTNCNFVLLLFFFVFSAFSSKLIFGL